MVEIEKGMGFFIVISVRLEQPSNAALPILVTVFGIVTLARFAHKAKVPFPRLVTDLGIVIFIRPEQLLNA